MKKIYLSICVVILSSFILFNTMAATTYDDLSDLLDDVNQVLQESPSAPEDVLQDVTEDYENIDTNIDDNSDSVSGYEVNQLLVLNEINAAVQDLAGGSMFNLNSSQCEYFKAFLCAHPFYDYKITYDGGYDYSLYYGYKIENGIADRIHIYRYQLSNYNYEYRIEFTEDVSVPNSNVYINSKEGSVIHEVQTAKFETIVQLAFMCMLVLWFFSKIIFR